jgi:hypothetical protein
MKRREFGFTLGAALAALTGLKVKAETPAKKPPRSVNIFRTQREAAKALRSGTYSDTAYGSICVIASLKGGRGPGLLISAPEGGIRASKYGHLMLRGCTTGPLYFPVRGRK